MHFYLYYLVKMFLPRIKKQTKKFPRFYPNDKWSLPVLAYLLLF